MRTCVDNYYTVFPFGKNSPYKPYVDRKLDQFTNAGIINYWFKLMTIKFGRSYMPGLFDKNNVKENTEKTSLSLSNLIGAFYVLGIGHILALIVFILEKVVHKR